MLSQVVAAFDRQDYKTVAQLLKQWQQQNPADPWMQFYKGRLLEATGKLQEAAALYRHLLRESTNSKVMAQSREGVQRVEALIQEQRKQAIAAAASDPEQAGLGFLVLEPIEGEARIAAAQEFARIMKLDAYTARLHLPSRSWRLYRVGSLAELQLYGQELRAAGIPAFWAGLAQVQSIRVFRVQHLQSVSPQATAVCASETDQLGSLSFNWSEVSRRVEGMLPIFEDVVDIDARNKLTRKEQTQDYAQVCDLHLPRRKCILRFFDRSYQFQNGVVFDARQDGQIPTSQATTRLKWNQLTGFLDDRLPQVPCWSDFTAFAETALEPLALVRDFNAYIDLFRKSPTRWDAAFQLYSALVFEHSKSKT